MKISKKVESVYDTLSYRVDDIMIPVNFPEEDKDVLEYINEMLQCLVDTCSKVNDMTEVIDTNDASPSKMADIEALINASDSAMITAVASLLSLDTKYGYTE